MMYEYILLLAVFVMIAVLVLFALSLINSIVRGVPQVGTYGEMRKIIEREVPEMIAPNTTLLDLGSGTGKMSRFFAKKCSIKVIGYEIDIGNWLVAKIVTLFSGITGITYRRSSFYHLTQKDLESIDYVYIYLFPGLMKKVEEQLVPKMKKGTILIVNSFVFPSLTPTKIFHRADKRPIIYIYTI